MTGSPWEQIIVDLDWSGSAEAEKQSMAITGLLRLEKKLALGLGRRHQYTHTSTEAVQHTEVGAFQLSFPRWSSIRSHICFCYSLEFILHVFLGTLDSSSIVKALILGKERREKRRGWRKKELDLRAHSMAPDTMRKHRVQGSESSSTLPFAVLILFPSPLPSSFFPSFPPHLRGHLITYNIRIVLKGQNCSKYPINVRSVHQPKMSTALRTFDGKGLRWIFL